MNGTAEVLLSVAAVDFGIQFLGWALAAALQTEVFYDGTGSLTFITLAIGSLCLHGSFAPRQIMLSLMMVIWALRLGTFLVMRISKAGTDSRFDKVRGNPPLFLLYWLLQGVWVFLTGLPVWLVAALPASQPALGLAAAAGGAVWLTGITIETLADHQKSQFKADPANEGKFIDTGLWAFARHPNYFGEMLLWCGVFIVSAGVLRGWQLALATLGPLFVVLFIWRVSGVPLLEKAAKKRWGDDPAFQAYVARTRLLAPLPKLGGFLTGYEEF